MKAGAGAFSTLNINLAAVSALLDEAVLDGAVCRHQEQLTRCKTQEAQCRILMS